MKVKFYNPYLSMEDKISVLQRFIIVHSWLYYVLDSPVISDKSFDELCKQYMKNKNKVKLSKTDYGYMFKDFDGNTGFDLPSRVKEEQKKYIEGIVFTLKGGNQKKLK